MDHLYESMEIYFLRTVLTGVEKKDTIPLTVLKKVLKVRRRDTE